MPGGIDLTLAEIETLKSLTTWLSGITSTLCLIVVSIGIAQPQRRKFPTRMITYFSASAAGFYLNIAVGAMANYKQIPQNNQPPDTFCLVQGALFQYFAASMSYWFVLIYFTLERVLTRGAKFSQIWQWENRFLTVGFALPLFVTALPAVFEHVGYEEGAFWCWIHEDGTWYWKFAIMYIPLGIILLTGLWWLGRVSRALCRTFRLQHLSSSDGGAEEEASRKLLLDYCVRHITFVASLALMYVGVLSWGVNHALWNEGQSSISFAFCVVEVFSVHTIGIATFVIFALSERAFTSLCSPQPCELARPRRRCCCCCCCRLGVCQLALEL